jgi:type II secretory pathway predicted ATPase ExeA
MKMNPSISKQVIRNDLFGFKTIPFRNPPKKPYLNKEKRLQLQELEAFVNRRGIAAIAGEPGSGKTALLRYFCENLPRNNHLIIYNPFTNGSENDLLRSLCIALDIEPCFHKNKTIANLQQRIKELGNINPILVLDELQNANHQLLECVRLLTNNDFDSSNRLTLILIGTEDLFRELKKKINESLRQRVTLYCRVRELSFNDTTDYVHHCLSQAGCDQLVFQPQSLKLLDDIARGCIRIINNLAAAALEAASHDTSSTVELTHMNQAEKICILPKEQINDFTVRDIDAF